MLYCGFVDNAQHSTVTSENKQAPDMKSMLHQDWRWQRPRGIYVFIVETESGALQLGYEETALGVDTGGMAMPMEFFSHVTHLPKKDDSN